VPFDDEYERRGQARGYLIADSEPGLAIAEDESGPYTVFYRVPRSSEDLVARGRLIESVCRLGAGAIVLKGVGSDAVFGILRAAKNEGQENIQAYWQHIVDGEVALAVAQSDVKGD
jgi:4-hydroxybutyryl-CoA dehydratase/vinylacetyl-CoA-Delta-isomerase